MVPDDTTTQRRNDRSKFQSALRFAVVPDEAGSVKTLKIVSFQSALRFAVVPDVQYRKR